jgi:phosphoserine phosphatase
VEVHVAPERTRNVLVTVAGPDTPGITATLTGILQESNARLLDIEQVVVHGQLTLCLVVGVDAARQSGDAVLKDLLFAAKDMGLELDFKILGATAKQSGPSGRQSYAVTAIGDEIDARAVHAISRVLAAHDANIDKIHRLSENAFNSFEIVLSLPSGEDRAHALRTDLIAAGSARGIDVALQEETLTRRAKRLIVMDMDSTLIRIECIDELARMHGVVDQVSDITRRAMLGELDFEASLRARVALLTGMPWAQVQQIADDLPIMEGAEKLIAVLKGLGMKTAVISGGFTFAAEALQRRLGLDYAYANTLEVKDGVLTGRVKDPIVTAQRKADLLEGLALQERISLEQIVAVGDGANDAVMIEKAGLGIAFHAKPKLRERADTSLSAGGLDRILYLLGLHARDIDSFLDG